MPSNLTNKPIKHNIMKKFLHYGDFLYDLSLRKIREGVYDIRWSGGILTGCTTCGLISVSSDGCSYPNLPFSFGGYSMPEGWQEKNEKVRIALIKAGKLARVEEELSLVLEWAKGRNWEDGVSDHDKERLFVDTPFNSGTSFHF